MELEEKIENKFIELIAEGGQLKSGNEDGQIRNEDHAYSCKGWLASAQNLVTSNSNNPYRTSVDSICTKD